MISASQIASINQTALIVRTDTAPKGILKVTGGGKIHPERQQEMTEMDDEEDDFQTVKLCPTTKCYTTIDTVFDNFCDGCASQTSTQRYLHVYISICTARVYVHMYRPLPHVYISICTTRVYVHMYRPLPHVYISICTTRVYVRMYRPLPHATICRIVNIPLTAASEPLQPSCNGKVVKVGCLSYLSS